MRLPTPRKALPVVLLSSLLPWLTTTRVHAQGGAAEYKPDLGVPDHRGGGDADVGIDDLDNEFEGDRGAQFKAVVLDAAQKTYLDPGLLSTVLLAEEKRGVFLRQSGEESTFTIGTDDIMAPEYQRVVRGMPAYEEAQLKSARVTDTNEQGRDVQRGVFPARNAALVVALYLKANEAKTRSAFAALGQDFDKLPIEVQFTFCRLAMNAGMGKVRAEAQRYVNGYDIPRSGSTGKNVGHPTRTAVLHAAEAIHLSQTIFGRDLQQAAK